MRNTEKTIIFLFLISSIFLILSNFTLGIANYTIDTLMYDDTTSDLITTNFEYYTNNLFIFDNGGYRNLVDAFGESGDGTTELSRVETFDKEIVGVDVDLLYKVITSDSGNVICFGEKPFYYIDFQYVLNKGYCYQIRYNLIYNIEHAKSNNIYTDNMFYDYDNSLYNSQNVFHNIKFYIDNGRIILNIDGVIRFNNTDSYTGEEYYPNENTTYMLSHRTYSGSYDSFINVTNIKDMVKHDCFPNWSISNSSCMGNKYYKIYTDLNDCGKPVPISNGTQLGLCNLDNYYINECGLFNVSNSIVHINITDFSNNPCLIFNVDNSSIDCDIEQNGTYTTNYAYIEHINNVNIHDCNINNFVQDFLIPEAYLIGDNENNSFYNINFDTLSSSAFGFDVRTENGQSLKHTSFQNINIKNVNDNGAVNMFGSGLKDMLFENINIDNAYTGMWLGSIQDLYINHYYMNGGTIYALLLYDTNNAIVENSKFDNIAFNTIAITSAYNIFFNNVENEISRDIPDMYFVGDNANFSSNTNYNTGWFPTQNILTNDNINTLSKYEGELKGYNIISDVLVFNKSIKYFLNPECLPSWVKFPMPCIDGVAIINYKDYNDCDKNYLIPLNNGTNEYCRLSNNNVFKLDPTLFLHIILILLIALTIIITVKGTGIYKYTYIFTGALLIIYSVMMFVIASETENLLYSSIVIYRILGSIFLLTGISTVIIGLIDYFKHN
jgi:hypothetical protein